MKLTTVVTTNTTGKITKVTGVLAGFYKQIQHLPDHQQLHELAEKVKEEGFKEDLTLRREDYEKGTFSKVFSKEVK